MKDRKQLLKHLKEFSGMSEEDFMQSTSFWYNKSIKKGEFFNMQNFVCSDLGFITNGLFRIYYFDEQSMEEKNMFFFSKGQFIVSFRSFIRQYPCIYYSTKLIFGSEINFSISYLKSWFQCLYYLSNFDFSLAINLNRILNFE